MISINMASKYINEKLSLRKRNGGHMWVKTGLEFFPNFIEFLLELDGIMIK